MGARSENLAVIIGNLTRDPEVKDTSGGHTVASFGVATNREWVTSGGEKKEDTQLHEVVAWDGLAKVCEQFLVLGSKVYVRGRLQTRTWDDEEGRRHYKTEIVSDKVVVLDSRNRAAEKREEEAEVEVDMEVGAEVEAVEESLEGEELTEDVEAETEVEETAESAETEAEAVEEESAEGEE